MRVHNIRHGFATNSSSSHSILILPQGTPPPRTSDWGNYGWDDFTLADEVSKRDYYDAQARLANGEPIDWDLAHVDHQSVWGDEGLSITDRVTRQPTRSPGIMSFLMGLLSHNRVIVLGGNDNSEGHPLRKVYEEAGAVDLSHNSSWSLTMDPKGHYVLFNPRSGTKLRLTESGEDAPAKGTWPELIDIKITDYCHYGCSYCYQGSTPEGRHADTEHLIALAERCAESGVLEVAIGGGEPTSHPDFERIVQAFRSAGVIVNVTSRNIAYWSEIPKVPVTAVAFSVDSAQQIETILKRFHGKYAPFQIHFQVVAGVVDGAEFERMMVAAQDHRLTLLGYKDTGRGREARASLPIHNHPSQTDWIAPWMARVQAYREAQGARDAWEVKREEFFYRTLKASGESRERKVEQWRNENPYPQPEHKPSIAIDTTLASVCKQELKKSGVPPISYHTSEGAFSMYIDAVSLQAGPSSYAPENMVPYSIDNIWQVFASIPSM